MSGRTLSARGVRVSPCGIPSILWNSLCWALPTGGAFVRFEGVPDMPGAPKTAVGLVGESCAAPLQHRLLFLVAPGDDPKYTVATRPLGARRLQRRPS